RYYDLICDQADKVLGQILTCTDDKVVLNIEYFSSQPEPVKIELIRRSLTKLGSGQRDLKQLHFKKILQLANENVSGRKIELPAGFGAQREYDKLIFTRDNPITTQKPIPAKAITVPGRTNFADYLIQASMIEVCQKDLEKFKAKKNQFTEWFDLTKVKLPLKIRFRRNGDKFQPLGLPAEKKIGKFLTAERLSHQLRQETMIIEDIEKIIWLCPVRISQQTRITAQTTKVLQLQVSRRKIDS
ncbi:MAG: tRNA lysidine(34) synthetase TilS, partial [Planctomycetota bacterium]